MNNKRRRNPTKSSNPSRPQHRNNRRRRGPKLSGFEKVEKSYYNLLDKHLEARKKYFDLYHRADPNQLRKLEKSFSNTLYELRNYLDGLDPKLKEKFEKKFNPNQEDHTYTMNHGLSPEAEHVDHSGNFEDPHFLPSQEEDFSQDAEESVGTLEDYKAYKGL